MVIEHTFVTTLEADRTINEARYFLVSGGFRPPALGFPIDSAAPTSLEVQRGQEKARRVKSALDLPQRVVLQFDRGRVTVAGSIDNNVTAGSFAMTSGHRSKRQVAMQTDMMMGIITGLELVLTQGVDPTTAAQQWRTAEQAIAAAKRRSSRRLWIILGVIVLLIALVITAAIVLD